MTDDQKVLGYKWIRTRSEIPEIYGNLLHPTWTLYDVRVRIGELIPDPQNPREFVVDERAALTISWPQAKLIAENLALLIDSYEQTNGKIGPLKLPPDPTTLSKSETKE